MSKKLTYAYNASKLHRSFGDLLISNGFNPSQILQEVPCKTIIPNYPNGRDRYDYVLPHFNVIIELHGEQHRSAVDFGGEGTSKAKRNLAERIQKDIQKQKFAEDAGWGFLTFWHDDDISWDSIWPLILEASDSSNIVKPKKQTTMKSKSGFSKGTGFLTPNKEQEQNYV